MNFKRGTTLAKRQPDSLSSLSGRHPLSVVRPRSTTSPRCGASGHLASDVAAYSLQSAFTIVELLVVISIIALLMGIIVPSYFSIREKAKYTKAKVTVKNLETAFKAYLDHYRVWPTEFGEGSAKDIDKDIVEILRGDKNDDEIAFYEFESTNSANGALDAWYDPYDPTTKTYYWVQVDHDYNNQITTPDGVIYQTVIVGSPGADRTNNTSDDVRSWD